jgi:hypothetical protein
MPEKHQGLPSCNANCDKMDSETKCGASAAAQGAAAQGAAAQGAAAQGAKACNAGHRETGKQTTELPMTIKEAIQA